MSKLFQLIFCIITSANFAQNAAIVTYNVGTNEPLMSSSEKMNSPSIVDIFDGVEDAMSKLNFTLFIENNKSKFILQKALAVDNRSSKIAISLADNSEYYRNDSTAIAKRFSYDNSYFVNFDLINNWVILKDSKTINGYLCYKATTTKIVVGRDSNKKIPVVAWFCPEIPFSYGPKQYGGLPGLILEISEGRMTFLATKVELNQKLKSDINLTISGEKIYSEEEFSAIALEKSKKIRENFGL